MLRNVLNNINQNHKECIAREYDATQRRNHVGNRHDVNGVGILIGRFVHLEYSGFSVSDFVEGILVGLSLVMNLAYLIRRAKK